MIQQVESVLVSRQKEIDLLRHELLIKDSVSIFQLNMQTKLLNSCI